MPLSRISNPFLSTATKVYSPSANTVAIRTSNTDQFTITSAGNITHNTTPSTWSTLTPATYEGPVGITYHYPTGGDYGIATNAYYDGNWRYKRTGGVDAVTQLILSGNPAGQRFNLRTAPTGTAGAAITFTNILNVEASPNCVTMPNQPSFHVKRSGAQTGVVTNTVLILNSETYDTTSNYNPTTGVFTAPVTGKYLFNATVLFQNITQGQQIDLELVTSNRTYYASPGRLNVQIGVTWVNDYITLSINTVADMDANDVAYIKCTSLSSGTITLYDGEPWTRWTGILLS